MCIRDRSGVAGVGDFSLAGGASSDSAFAGVPVSVLPALAVVGAVLGSGVTASGGGFAVAACVAVFSSGVGAAFAGGLSGRCSASGLSSEGLSSAAETAENGRRLGGSLVGGFTVSAVVPGSFPWRALSDTAGGGLRASTVCRVLAMPAPLPEVCVVSVVAVALAGFACFAAAGAGVMTRGGVAGRLTSLAPVVGMAKTGYSARPSLLSSRRMPSSTSAARITVSPRARARSEA